MKTYKEHQCIDENKLIVDIKKFGWAVLIIEKTDYLPRFAYTIGLWKNFNQPELISFGLTSRTLHSILNIGGELAKSGQRLIPNKEYLDFFENNSTRFLEVDERNISDYFGYAIWFNGLEKFPSLQLVWTDRNNKFPWDNNYEKEFKFKQPLLDRNAHFKFLELKNTAICTTRQWLYDKKEILHVVHNQNGDWQFLTGDQTVNDIKIVSLEQLILRDQTLNEIFNLDFGEEAKREKIGGNWIRSKILLDDDL